jgi:hypothetical protein
MKRLVKRTDALGQHVDHDVDIVGRSRFALEARDQRAGQHQRDAQSVTLGDNTLQ